MIDVEDFIVFVCNYNLCINVDLICDVYEYGCCMYEGQFCQLGEFYFMYLVFVVVILIEMWLDDVMIIIVLLYDMIEDICLIWGEVLQMFGCEIVDLVDGVIKLINL